MMKVKNATHIEGYLYEHTLELKVSGSNSKNPGTKFINGTLSVATDNECVNIVPVHFSYTTATFASSNKPNATFEVLKGIIDGKYGTIMKDGKENAAKVRIDSAIALNEFYTERDGKEELVSAKRNEGGFVHIVDVLDEDERNRNTFKCDMLITNVREVEADEEKNLPAKAIVKGAIFDFRKALLPVEFSAVNPAAISYFVGLEATNKNPVFTQVRGRQVSQVVTKTYTDESAFGEADVREVSSTRKDFVLTWAAKEPYAWDDEETMTAVELTEAIAARETYLASVKQRQDEYKASKSKEENAITPVEQPTQSEFKF